MSHRLPLRASLPPLPRVALVIEGDERDTQGYLRMRRTRLHARWPDGARSVPFAYDTVERKALDAVVIAAHFRDDSGERCVVLRSAIRPPVALRPEGDETQGLLWEVPAGLIEEDERGEEGRKQCAARELFEETGARVELSGIEPLGPSTFPSPGVIGERHYYFHAEIDPSAMTEPPEDGSVLEENAIVLALPLRIALQLVRKGEIQDAKTEIALRRLAEL